MFDEKREITMAVEALYEVASKLNRGQILTHEDIGELLKLRPHEGRWDHIVSRVRRRIERERGIATWFVKGVGYELLTKPKQLELPQWRLKKSARQHRLARKSVQALPEKGLSVEERRYRHMIIERLRESEQAIRDDLSAQESLLKPTAVIPRRALV